VELSRGEQLLGVNPYMASAVGNQPTLEAERTALGEKGNALDYRNRTSLGSFLSDWLYCLH
jgi:hypothetical protein